MWDKPTPAWQTDTGVADRRADERTGQTGEGVADRRKILGSALFRRKCPHRGKIFRRTHASTRPHLSLCYTFSTYLPPRIRVFAPRASCAVIYRL